MSRLLPFVCGHWLVIILIFAVCLGGTIAGDTTDEANLACSNASAHDSASASEQLQYLESTLLPALRKRAEEKKAEIESLEQSAQRTNNQFSQLQVHLESNFTAARQLISNTLNRLESMQANLSSSQQNISAMYDSADALSKQLSYSPACIAAEEAACISPSAHAKCAYVDGLRRLLSIVYPVTGVSTCTSGTSEFGRTHGVVETIDGDIFVLDYDYHCVKRIHKANGTVTAYAGKCSTFGQPPADGNTFKSPVAIALMPNGSIAISDEGANCIKLITGVNQVSTIMGTCSASTGSGDGPQLAGPYGIAATSSGDLLVAVKADHCVKKLSADGTVSTVAGTCSGSSGTGGDGNHFQDPLSVTPTADGGVLVPDFGDGCVKKISANGNAETVAGICSDDNVGDGVKLSAPTHAIEEADGSIIVVDSSAHCIKRFSGNSATTIAGSCSGTPGTGGGNAFNLPLFLAHTSTVGDYLVVDQTNYCIKKMVTKMDT